MSDTITLPRSLVEQITRALSKAIDANVAIQAIIGTMAATDHTVGGKLFAIDACISEQERFVCPASDELRDALEASHA